MELINEALIVIDSDNVDNIPTQGLMCLDACRCTGNCTLVQRYCD